jgi:hypothetical protein
VGEHDGRQATEGSDAAGEEPVVAGGIDQHVAPRIGGAHQQVAAGSKALTRCPAAVVDFGKGMGHQEGGGAVAPEEYGGGADGRHRAGLLGQQGPHRGPLPLWLLHHPGLAPAGGEVGWIPSPAGAAVDAAGIDIERAWGVGGQAAGQAGHWGSDAAARLSRGPGPNPMARGATAARPPGPGLPGAQGQQRGAGVRCSGHWSCAHPGRRCP